ncbi:helix-turn-helix domain-containing protein [Alkaliphilus peptidifermentans]|uniref:DNA binding domain-containing protein, excisionase family n=1 Tax=Alkaliphilus peptidifermentans DSM 18978 TaxID=1120976 RepID=A0A1G5KR21_9FIRM|nr:helix-turn-helix domain-containing protein [Alkaliphilus peptidifermentans]SCZ03037.1 DNA binding domain-containing protein, excisionase family [Alkaliphilus peptidifermentans DSM 18978]
MEHKFYTIDQIAALLGMHHKTIRKFITEGKLGASKVGKQWRISGHDLSVFMEKNNDNICNEEIEEELNIDYSTVGNEKETIQRRVNVSTVIDINEIEKDQYMRVSNTLIAVANCKDPEISKSTINVKFDEKDKRVRVILWGSIEFIENMLSTISMIVD